MYICIHCVLNNETTNKTTTNTISSRAKKKNKKKNQNLHRSRSRGRDEATQTHACIFTYERKANTHMRAAGRCEVNNKVPVESKHANIAAYVCVKLAALRRSHC